MSMEINQWMWSIQDRCSLEFINGGYLLQVHDQVGWLFRDNIIHPTLRMALLGAPLIHQSYLYGASLLVPVFIANGCIVFERDLSYTPMRASLSLSLQFAFLFNWYWYWWLCPKAFLCPSDHPEFITFSNVVVSKFLRQCHIIVNQKYRVIVYRLKYILWHTNIS